jgi:hypothetical protein
MVSNRRRSISKPPSNVPGLSVSEASSAKIAAIRGRCAIVTRYSVVPAVEPHSGIVLIQIKQMAYIVSNNRRLSTPCIFFYSNIIL